MNISNTIETKKRSEHIDALRGWALFGILLMNIEFLGGAFLDMSFGNHRYTDGVDIALSYIIQIFITGSFWVIFSFLFGTSLVLSSLRHPPSWQYKRLFILFILGLAHSLFLWDGDILVTYAISALIVWSMLNKNYLLPTSILLTLSILSFIFNFDIDMWLLSILLLALVYVYINNDIKDYKRWLFSGLFLYLFIPCLMIIALLFIIPDIDKVKSLEDTRGQIINGYNNAIGESYFLSIKTRWTLFITNILSSHAVVLSVIAMMSFGIYFAKKELYKDIEQNVKLWRYLSIIGISFGFIINSLPMLAHSQIPTDHLWSLSVYPSIIEMGNLLLGMGFVGFFFYLYSKRSFISILNLASPAGKMALSSYIMQSAIGLFLFSPFALNLQIDYKYKILTACILFIFQIYISKLYLSHFKQGPFEFIWRKLSSIV